MTERIKVTPFKRSNGVWYVQYRDPVSELKVQKSTGSRKKSDANRIARDWEKEVNSGRSWKDGDIGWQQFRDRFDSEHLEGLAPRTMEKANSVLDSFERIIKPVNLAKVNAQTLSRYQQELRKLGRADATIKGHFAYLQSALTWAKAQRLINEIPAVPKVKRAEKSDSTTPMKGRPITLEEFERLVMAIGKVITLPNNPATSDASRLPSWEYLVKGLWLSGLRLGEAMELHWSDDSKFRIVLEGGRPKFSIPAASQKSNRAQLVPMTPDFAAFILGSTPANRRRGFVFNPLSLLDVHSKDANRLPQRLTTRAVGKAIGKIGAKAGIVVDEKRKGGKKTPVFASAHDLRRSFGERWSERVMPKILRELMRHADINTTMRFYVGHNADRTADLLWSQFGAMEPEFSPMGDNLGDTCDSIDDSRAPKNIVSS